MFRLGLNVNVSTEVSSECKLNLKYECPSTNDCSRCGGLKSGNIRCNTFGNYCLQLAWNIKPEFNKLIVKFGRSTFVM